MKDYNYQLIQTIAMVFTAIGTVMVAFIGVLFKKYLDYRNTPNLELRYDANLEIDNKYLAPISTHDESEEVWIKARIVNTSKITAKDVELRLLWIKRENNTWDNRPSWWFKVSNLNMIGTNIPPKFVQSFDLAHVKNYVNNKNDLSFHLTLVSPHLSEWGEEKSRIENDIENKLFIGGKYTMLIALICSNANAKYYKMEMNVLSAGPNDKITDGQIGTDAIKKRLVCKLIGEVNPDAEPVQVNN